MTPIKIKDAYDKMHKILHAKDKEKLTYWMKKHATKRKKSDNERAA